VSLYRATGIMFSKLLLLFITVPLVEFFLLMKIGMRIGIVPTIATIFITGIFGAWLTRVQGLRTLRRFQEATKEGRLPHEEVMDGMMILVAGAVLLTPGFLTDAVGFLLLAPSVRMAVRKQLSNYLMGRIQFVGPGASQMGRGVDNRNISTQGGRGAGAREVKARVIDFEIDSDK
jgi:UPF0716 protein FxsA